MTLRQTHSVPVASAKAGLSTATGYRLSLGPNLPSHKKSARGRRRQDPLGEVFDAEVIPLLKSSSGLRPVAIWEELLGRRPDLTPGIRRRLEQHIRGWRAEHGPEQEVMFRQLHTPGKMGLSDFTTMAKLGVTIAGAPLDHRLYHFRLACSGFEHAHVVLGKTLTADESHRESMRLDGRHAQVFSRPLPPDELVHERSPGKDPRLESANRSHGRRNRGLQINRCT